MTNCTEINQNTMYVRNDVVKRNKVVQLGEFPWFIWFIDWFDLWIKWLLKIVFVFKSVNNWSICLSNKREKEKKNKAFN